MKRQGLAGPSISNGPAAKGNFGTPCACRAAAKTARTGTYFLMRPRRRTQNSSRSPSCIARIGLESPVITPALPAPASTAPLGLARLVRLKMLKLSHRNCSDLVSVRGNRLENDQSAVKRFGPRSELWAALPYL